MAEKGKKIKKKSDLLVPLQIVESLWRVRDVAKYIGITEQTVHKMCRQKRLPYRKLGVRLLVFLPSEIFKVIENSERLGLNEPFLDEVDRLGNHGLDNVLSREEAQKEILEGSYKQDKPE